MQTITVNKTELLQTLRENRNTHNADYELAWQGFKEKAIEAVDQKLHEVTNVSFGDDINLYIPLAPPTHHLNDYDRAIGMLEWEVGDTIELDQHEFQTFVQDNWNWKANFQTANVQYAGSVSPSKFRS